MAGVNTRRSRREKVTIDVVGIGPAWTTPVKVERLGESGLLARGVVRGVGAWATGGIAAAEVKVWYGSGYSTSTDPALVPDEDVAWHETAIAVVGSATAADLDKDLLALHRGAMFDIRQSDEEMWLAFYADSAVVDESVVISLEAVDTL
jgi:hypothetical protein